MIDVPDHGDLEVGILLLHVRQLGDQLRRGRDQGGAIRIEENPTADRDPTVLFELLLCRPESRGYIELGHLTDLARR